MGPHSGLEAAKLCIVTAPVNDVHCLYRMHIRRLQDRKLEASAVSNAYRTGRVDYTCQNRPYRAAQSLQASVTVPVPV